MGDANGYQSPIIPLIYMKTFICSLKTVLHRSLFMIYDILHRKLIDVGE